MPAAFGTSALALGTCSATCRTSRLKTCRLCAGRSWRTCATPGCGGQARTSVGVSPRSAQASDRLSDCPAQVASPETSASNARLWLSLVESPPLHEADEGEVLSKLRAHAKHCQEAGKALRMDVLKRTRGRRTFATLIAGEALEQLDGAAESLNGSCWFKAAAEYPSLLAWRRPSADVDRNAESSAVDSDDGGMRSAPELALERLGVRSVVVYIGRARAADGNDTDALFERCVAHAQQVLRQGEALRSAALLQRDHSDRADAENGAGGEVWLLEAFPAYSDFALFDSSLGDELLDDDGWSVSRFENTADDGASWTLPSRALAEQWELPELSPLRPSRPPDVDARAAPAWESAESGASAEAGLQDPLRVWLGSDALPRLRTHLWQRHRQNSTGATLVISGWNQARLSAVIDELEDDVDSGRLPITLPGLSVADGARLDTVRHGVELCRAQRAHTLVAIGGGSVMDVARATAALAAAPSEVAARIFAQIEAAAQRACASGGVEEIVAVPGVPVLPLVLVPSAGTGVDVACASGSALLAAEDASRDPTSGRVFVRWDGGNVDSAEEKARVVVADPRLMRRVPAARVELGATVCLCSCVETLLRTPLEADGNETTYSLALEGGKLAQRVLAGDEWRRADDDAAFHQLLSAAVMAGGAREAAGLGVAAALALCVDAHARAQDNLEDAASDFPGGAEEQPMFDSDPELLERAMKHARTRFDWHERDLCCARSFVRLLPALMDAGAYEEGAVQGVAEHFVEPGTAPRLVTYLRRLAERTAPPPEALPRPAAVRMANALASRPLRSFARRAPSTEVLLRALDDAELAAADWQKA